MPCSPDEDDSNAMTRFPLTPIPVGGHYRTDDDAKSTSSASFSRSHSDDELRDRPSLYQRRKSSVTALALARPPYHRRRSYNRRASPARNSPGLPTSLTPIHANFNSERRTSLPALHFHETVDDAMPIRIETRTSACRDTISDDMYGRLHSFTFGAPPQVGQDSDESDEDERQRRDRAKMRAIDDGTRRPSLPTNSNTPMASRPQSSVSSVTSSAGIVVGELQYEEYYEPAWDVIMGDTTPTKASPPPPRTPSSSHTSVSVGSQSDPRRPSLPIAVPVLRRRSRSADELATDLDARTRTPTPRSTGAPYFTWVEDGHPQDDTRDTSSSPENNAAYEGYDLGFIMDGTDAAAAAANDDSRLQRHASHGRLRGRFRKQAPNAQPPRAEDSFAGHLGVYDPEYALSKNEWTFRREVGSNNTSSPKSKDKDRAGRDRDEPQEDWRCQWIGRFVVVKLRSDRAPVPGTDAPKAPYNRLQIVHAPDPHNKSSTGGPRVLVHRHSRARAFSIFRGHTLPRKIMVPTDSILLAVKSVLREYTRTESTRALKTYGLTDDTDAHVQHQHHHHPHSSRSALGRHVESPRHSQSGSERPRSKSTSRPPGSMMHESNRPSTTTHDVKRSSAPGFSKPAKHSTSPIQYQPPETRSRKTSTHMVPGSSPSGSRSVSASRPSSLAPSRTPVNASPPSDIEHPPVLPREAPSPTSPRTSTSHAEAFAMRDLEVHDPDLYHHRDESGTLHVHSGQPAARPHAPPLPPPGPTTPSPPHGQRNGLGFGERLKRAFGSTKPQSQALSKEQKEPVSPVMEDDDEPKTANQDGKFAPPWLTVVRRSEKEQHERMIRTLNDSFESVGLIPPQDKKKPTKPRSTKGSKGEECPAFEKVPDNSMCMLLPLWPDDTESLSGPSSQTLSRHSSRSRAVSTRHVPTQSVAAAITTATIPLQERKFLLVYYNLFDQEHPTDDNANGGINNKKRRRPQTASERPQHRHHTRAFGGPYPFRVTALLLDYDDVRSSGVRLPERGLAITSSVDEAAMAVPSDLQPLAETVIATCDSPEQGVQIDQEGLVKLGLVVPIGSPTGEASDDADVRLSAVGRAIIEMVWSGCLSLMSFEA